MSRVDSEGDPARLHPVPALHFTRAITPPAAKARTGTQARCSLALQYVGGGSVGRGMRERGREVGRGCGTRGIHVPMRSKHALILRVVVMQHKNWIAGLRQQYPSQFKDKDEVKHACGTKCFADK